MLKLFNALQIVALFVAFPYGLSWLNHEPFSGAAIFFWAGCAVYLGYVSLMVGAVLTAIDEWEC